MRFLGLGPADTVPDANTIWTFREALTRARLHGKPAIEVVFAQFDAALPAARFLEGRPHPTGMGEQAGQIAPEGPRRALDGQYTKAKPSEDGAAQSAVRDNRL
jgi:Transposase domain (DUF772)